MKIILGFIFLSISFCIQADTTWTDWEQFKRVYISPQGRVIDGSTPQMMTTSEGQSYALLCALIANDRETFDNVLNWTETNLSNGDLTAQLPSWLWGIKKDSTQTGVLDPNSAADSDLWIAYTLSEAGRIWDDYRYKSLGYFLATRILNEESAKIPNVGTVILPGKIGFKLSETSWRLNPSYLPLQIFRRFSVLYPASSWNEIAQNSANFLKQSAPNGFSPEWAILNANNQITPDEKDSKIGGYNAIRVYLWLGMLSDEDSEKAALMAHFSPMLKAIQTDGFVSEQFDTKTNTQIGNKKLGFNAAVLPFLISAKESKRLNELVEQINVREFSDKPNQYYDSVLILMGKGWLEHRYRFDKTGMLVLKQ